MFHDMSSKHNIVKATIRSKKTNKIHSMYLIKIYCELFNNKIFSSIVYQLVLQNMCLKLSGQRIQYVVKGDIALLNMFLS